MRTTIIHQRFLTMGLLFALLVSCSAVFAHAKYERSDPGRRSVLTRSPEVIKIWFSEQLEPAYSTIVVKNKAGDVVSEQKAVLAEGNDKLLSLTLPTLEAGKYSVFYRVLSVDGHVVDSKFKFRIKQAKPVQP
ncbi:hypothetical protein A9Q80_05235 [Cycloclasticus sp. 46_83_sub15_T18]|nr:hypothetical protein A9Q80_05235 [Cycloclasticus sp. 46_83_sub15_T18]